MPLPNAGPTMLVPLHGLGGAQDLPIPASLAIAGGTAALLVSFCVLILAWRQPRYAPDAMRASGRPLPSGLASVLDSAAYLWGLRIVGLAVTAYLTWALLAGPDLVTNPVFGTFYVLLWVGIVPASLFFGRVYRAFSPVRTLNILIARVFGGDPTTGLYSYPERLGYWPAAVGLFGFVWQELVNPQQAYLGPLRLWLAVYLAAMLIGSAIFGDTWFERADPFEVYSNLLAKLSPWARNDRGVLVLRSPLANLATTHPRPGLVAVVAVLLGSTAFDSYQDTLSWVNLLERLGTDAVATNTVAMLAFCAAVGVTFTVATMATGVDPDSPYAGTRRALPALFAHSMIPIIVGYMVAHYLSYLVEQGQATILQLSDPMVRGDNFLGTADWSVNYWLSFHPTLLATIKVLAIVCGHLVGVIAAHDRALTLLPKQHQITGQLGLLVVMVFYTGTGLYLLFGG